MCFIVLYVFAVLCFYVSDYLSRDRGWKLAIGKIRYSAWNGNIYVKIVHGPFSNKKNNNNLGSARYLMLLKEVSSTKAAFFSLKIQ